MQNNYYNNNQFQNQQMLMNNNYNQYNNQFGNLGNQQQLNYFHQMMMSQNTNMYNFSDPEAFHEYKKMRGDNAIDPSNSANFQTGLKQVDDSNNKTNK